MLYFWLHKRFCLQAKAEEVAKIEPPLNLIICTKTWNYVLEVRKVIWLHILKKRVRLKKKNNKCLLFMIKLLEKQPYR